MKILQILLSILSLNISAKEISFSFDDAPRGDGAYYSGAQRAKILVDELQKSNVPQAIFYANPGKVSNPALLERLNFYKKSGHLIGNHTFDHLSADQNSTEIFIDNVWQADQFLRNKELFSPYFRFPYLQRGKTLPKILRIQNELEQMGLLDGYVTIDTYDFYMDRIFQDALLKNQKISIKNLKKFYVEILMTSINFYNDLAIKVLGRSPKHVILLHENDLSALCLGDLIKRLKAEDWKIISPIEAYTDKDLNTLPKVLVHNQGRIAAKAIELGFEGVVNSGVESKEAIDELFKFYQVATE